MYHISFSCSLSFLQPVVVFVIHLKSAEGKITCERLPVTIVGDVKVVGSRRVYRNQSGLGTLNLHSCH